MSITEDSIVQIERQTRHWNMYKTFGVNFVIKYSKDENTSLFVISIIETDNEKQNISE